MSFFFCRSPCCALGFITCLALGAVGLATFGLVFGLEDLQSWKDEDNGDVPGYDELEIQ